MEIHFEQKQVNCLMPLLRQLQTGEQTQEIRLPEEMPDVGRIIAGWGQIILRSKEWRGDSIHCSGGIMCRVLYEPEDVRLPQVVEGWLPFQVKWNLDDGLREGNIRLQCKLRSVDARSVSARKIMLRCGYGIMAEATRDQKLMIPVPGQVTQDVQLKIGRYPVRLAREAGEKRFLVEEELPPLVPDPEKIVAYTFCPKITDAKIHGDKLSFRGVGQIHLVALSREGEVFSRDLEVPFSQIAQLDGEFGPDARADLVMALTSLDMDRKEGGNLLVKANVVAQYTVDDRQMLELVEDAYSTARELRAVRQSLDLPEILEDQQFTLPVTQSIAYAAEKIADVVYWPDFPVSYRNENLEVEFPGMFQSVWYDAEGKLRSTITGAAEKWTGICADGCVFEAAAEPDGAAMGSPGGSISLKTDILVRTRCRRDNAASVVAGLELGRTLDNSGKPSMVLCRSGGKHLWDLARENGSTVAAICQTNALEGEPEERRLLLIPVVGTPCPEYS